jgi:hypothetical protein
LGATHGASEGDTTVSPLSGSTGGAVVVGIRVVEVVLVDVVVDVLVVVLVDVEEVEVDVDGMGVDVVVVATIAGGADVVVPLASAPEPTSVAHPASTTADNANPVFRTTDRRGVIVASRGRRGARRRPG